MDVIKRWFLKRLVWGVALFEFHSISPTDVKPNCGAYGGLVGERVGGGMTFPHCILGGVHHLGVGDTDLDLDWDIDLDYFSPSGLI